MKKPYSYLILIMALIIFFFSILFAGQMFLILLFGESLENETIFVVTPEDGSLYELFVSGLDEVVLDYQLVNDKVYLVSLDPDSIQKYNVYVYDGFLKGMFQKVSEINLEDIFNSLFKKSDFSYDVKAVKIVGDRLVIVFNVYVNLASPKLYLYEISLTEDIKVFQGVGSIEPIDIVEGEDRLYIIYENGILEISFGVKNILEDYYFQRGAIIDYVSTERGLIVISKSMDQTIVYRLYNGVKELLISNREYKKVTYLEDDLLALIRYEAEGIKIEVYHIPESEVKAVYSIDYSNVDKVFPLGLYDDKLFLTILYNNLSYTTISIDKRGVIEVVDAALDDVKPFVTEMVKLDSIHALFYGGYWDRIYVYVLNLRNGSIVDYIELESGSHLLGWIPSASGGYLILSDFDGGYVIEVI